jgi:arylsulfatase A-like enzyme
MRRDSLAKYLALLIAACPAAQLSAAQRPDVVIIIGDDIGYSDFGCYGGEIETPHIDRLAAEGLRFTQYHTENMCEPTRATLLTGRYHIRGFSAGNNVTIPEALSTAGYRRCMSGKWHCSDDPGGRTAPLDRGFEKFFGTPMGCGSFFAPLNLTRDGRPAEQEWRDDPDFYYTDAISANAVRDIRETPRDQPLFLYVAYTAGHWPLHARPEDIAKYRGRYAGGWDALRQERLERMKALGVVPKETALSPRNPEVPAWEEEPHRDWQQRRMEVYAAQLDRMDQGIGHILAALEERGKFDETLLLFTVDNGGCHVEYTPERKGDFLNEQTRDGRPLIVGNRPEVLPGPEETWQSYGHGWANASNTPFRLFKQYNHAGGVRVPLIARWPAVLKTGGGLTDQVAHVIDFLPTVLDAAGVDYPTEFADRSVAPADGNSLVPVLRGERREEHPALFWAFNHGSAVRAGQWKLVAEDNKPWELYDVAADPVELNNLASSRPEKAAELARLWDDWASASKAPLKRRKGAAATGA